MKTELSVPGHASRVAILLAVGVAGSSLAGQAAPTGVVVLTNAQIVDADGVRPGMHTVIVRDGRIERIADGVVPSPGGATLIDVQGRWLAPGMIDVHTHIATIEAAQRALASGVTTVRSASVPAYQDVGLKALARDPAATPLPDMFATGVFVTPDLGESILADPRLHSLARGVTSDESLRLVVNVNADRGVDWIKTRGTERAGLANTDPRKQVYSEAQLRVIVEAARARGLPVMAHAHGDEGARAAVLAGVRSIEHGSFLSDSTLRLMQERGVYFAPTYVTIEEMSQPTGINNDGALSVRGRYMLPSIQRAIVAAHKMGVKLVTGVDNYYDLLSAWRVSHEVARFVEFGVPPQDALAAATVNPAEMLGIGDRVGRVREGMDADLIVVQANPLEDIRELQDVLVVITNGRVGVNRLPLGAE